MKATEATSLHTLEEISADTLAFKKEAEWLLDDLLKGKS
jgi:hypothetical protein